MATGYACCGGVALVSDLSDKLVRPCIPRGLPAAVWYGSGEDVPQGYARQLDGNGGMRVAWAWRLHKTYKTYKTYKMMMGAPRDTPWVCMSLAGLARVMICRWGML